ncbi:uncharacterized protein LOC125490853 [Plutella xylostella]|uniref:uncharacterized protein LOC125490853 n=1 Tax=Plutella xylostella TaxID=51655 RepID=UPI002032EAF6|nr:uncharacterized protein LOC125490853 [Plutella xylostella]XP_048487179.1 uncharacterized protein LOC125490853 [Plutella xylostella]
MSLEPSAPRSSAKSPTRGVTDELTDKLIRELVRKRGIVKGRLTRFSNYLANVAKDSVLKAQDRIDLKLRIQGATSLFAEFNELQTKLEESVNECDLNSQLDQREQFEDSYYGTIAQAELILNSGEVTNSSHSSSNKNLLKSVQLPTISMPTFDGSFERWLEFRDTFSSLVHNSTDITNIQKFHYLKSSLKGSAALIIDALEFSSDNYNVAWELLLNRYNNNRLLVQNHIKALFNLNPLPKESAALIRTLIDTILKNLRALNMLGEPTQHWDTLVVYMIVSKLDKTTEREWEQYKGSLLAQKDSKIPIKSFVPIESHIKPVTL